MKKKKRNVSRDLLQGQLNLKPIPENPPRQPLVYLEDFNKNKISKLFEYVEDDMVEGGAQKQFHSFDIKQEKTTTSCNLLVINEDLTNCDMVDTIIFYKFLMDFMEDYLRVSLHTKLEV